MFENLKSKNNHKGTWKNMENATNYHISPGASTSTVKGNEKDRMVNCRVCGFPCDMERDGMAKDGSWAGLGIAFGTQLTAGTSIGDRRVPAAGAVATTVDQYYNRTVNTGCPCCGTLTFYL